MGMAARFAQAEVSFNRQTEDTLLIRFAGSWKMADELPSANEVQRQLEAEAGIQRVTFDSRDISSWDSGLVTFLIKVIESCSQKRIEVDREGLPKGVRGLLDLASAVPERKGARREAVREFILSRIGGKAIDAWQSVVETLAFIGEAFLVFLKFLIGKATFRRSEFVAIIQACSVGALPIVSLISILVGLILAFTGAVQLRMFGAEIYVADLVGIAMIRVMGAIMTGVIMAGRTGAAFAAELGTMQVNEEIDALHTLGVSPMEFLVLPRMLALTLVMPLLTLYADLMGVLGGLVVAVTMLGIDPMEYYNQTQAAVKMYNIWIGLFHALVFGVLISLAGCLRGMQCGRSASAVGQATTSAVVTSIVAIVVATGIITTVLDVVGIR
jgi:phospholipid/cholesterol/gamma-HCH transport system permease protein